MEVGDGEVVLDKEPNDLDRLLLAVSDALESAGVTYAAVSGYVAVLLGRARATEDIDVLVERFDATTADDLADGLTQRGFWGPAMPLDRLHGTLAEGLPFRIAEDGHRVPNVELKFPTDEYDRASLRDRVTVRFGTDSFTVGSLELQIAYKLRMDARKDREDALHLYRTLEDSLDVDELEQYVERLGVETAYDRLRGDG